MRHKAESLTRAISAVAGARGTYNRVLESVKALREKKPGDPLRDNLVVWMEYIVRFKALFDATRAGGDVRDDLDDFLAWAESTVDDDVCVTRVLARYLPAWKQALAEGRHWYHFNIPWEDDYVRRYDELLNSDW